MLYNMAGGNRAATSRDVVKCILIKSCIPSCPFHPIFHNLRNMELDPSAATTIFVLKHGPSVETMYLLFSSCRWTFVTLVSYSN